MSEPTQAVPAPPDDHHVLLPRTPWAGPAAIRIGGPELYLQRGAVVDPPAEPFRFELRVDAKAPDAAEFPPLDLHDGGDGCLLMSPKLVGLLGMLGVDNLQLFACEVVYAPTGATVEYQVANIIGLVPALDVARSECEVDEDGFVETFFTMHLDESRIAGLDLFRMYESTPSIIVSRRVKDALEAQAITGVRLLRDVEWEPGML